MLLRFLPLTAFLFCTLIAFPQRGTLYDDTRVSSVHLTLSPDSLAVLYDSVLSDHYYLARFIFDDTEHRDTLENVGFRLRGNTSRYSQKKSFKISFNEYVPGRKYQGVKKLNLNGEHNDPTMIREKLYYDLWKRAGMPERRTSFVRVYINGIYYGLYTNIEEFDKEWLKQVYPDEDGNLFKCTYPADLVYHGSSVQTYKELQNSTVTGGRVYDLKTNEAEDDYTRLVEMITLLNQPPTGDFAQQVARLVNVDLFLRALALDVATGNWDDYAYNKNNYYLYQDPADSVFDFITYDPDNTFGIDWFGIDWARRDVRNWVNPSLSLPLAQKLLAVPGFNDLYLRYADTIARLIIDTTVVFPRIDSLKALIRPAAVEDTWRTRDYGYSVADFDNSFTQPVDSHTPYGLKPFFSVRRQSLLDQLHGAGSESAACDRWLLSVFPNPAGNHLRVVCETPLLPGNPARLTDVRGRTVREFVLEGRITEVSLDVLSPGIYSLRTTINGRDLHVTLIRKP